MVSRAVPRVALVTLVFVMRWSLAVKRSLFSVVLRDSVTGGQGVSIGGYA